MIESTENIRHMFASQWVDAELTFDRWLEQHDAEVAKATEERIIKLLEEDAIAWSPQCSLPLDIEHCQYCAERVLLIESIKGENE